MTTKELICQKIEQLEEMDYPVDTYEQSVGFYNALDRIKAFLDTIEEPVTDCHELEEVARECSKTIYNKPLSGNPQEGYIVYDPDKYDAFIARAEWQKAVMMEGAVEGVVCYGSKGAYVESDWLGTTDVEVYGDSGSKVRIIIVKEEE